MQVVKQHVHVEVQLLIIQDQIFNLMDLIASPDATQISVALL